MHENGDARFPHGNPISNHSDRHDIRIAPFHYDDDDDDAMPRKSHFTYRDAWDRYSRRLIDRRVGRVTSMERGLCSVSPGSSGGGGNTDGDWEAYPANQACRRSSIRACSPSPIALLGEEGRVVGREEASCSWWGW